MRLRCSRLPPQLSSRLLRLLPGRNLNINLQYSLTNPLTSTYSFATTSNVKPPKPTMDTTRQTRLQFRRQAKELAASTATSPITTLLSQYELLISLCQHLSSADIIHLGATSTEHWQYVTGSPKLLKTLIGNSSCDGTGIIAQARVLGHWNADPSQATRKCSGKDAEPCHDCGAMVCNVATSRVPLLSSRDHC